MINRQWLILTLMLTLLAQTACTPAANPTVDSMDTCPTETADLKILTNAEDGYCLLYPAAYSTEVPHFIVINPTTRMAGDVLGDA